MFPGQLFQVAIERGLIQGSRCWSETHFQLNQHREAVIVNGMRCRLGGTAGDRALRAVVSSEKRGAEPDDEELLSLSKRLVEDAVLKAVQQYMEETQQTSSGPDVKPGQSLNTSASTSK
ncbi:hypothetical protein JZ751_005046 [Albula glossodonta]|uniref:A-kinase anchor protein 7 RI-RII subunit-binding domain-containing protein n=1 Tax=Albula glossodonta TaxID=121402 RepID=A0A8T2P5B2_9TELE|nr:hypothetical protein JZ751_005046 [Albula glossodonta]